MESTSGYVGSGVSEIVILCLGCHCTDDDLRVNFPLIFIPHSWNVIALGRIMGARNNVVVGGIIGVIFLLLLPC